jgi:hypothetical protein
LMDEQKGENALLTGWIEQITELILTFNKHKTQNTKHKNE